MNENISYFLKKGFLVSPDFLDKLNSIDKSEFFKLVEEKIKNKESLILLNNDLSSNIFSGNNLSLNWLEFDNSRVLFEKNKNSELYKTFLDILNYDLDSNKKEELNNLLEEVKTDEKNLGLVEENGDGNNVIILKSYNDESKKRDIQDFVAYFKNRYEFLKEVLSNRKELQNAISIKRLLGRDKNEKGAVSLVGLIYDKNITKNGNIILKLEDKTSIIPLIITKNNPELFNLANNLVLDEVIGINGFCGDNVVFVNSIFFPDVPLTKELKKCNEEVYCVFTSDLHIGSKLFLEEDFSRFIDWLNCKDCSDEEKKIVEKINYLFIAGDLIDGIGIYPGQEEDLIIKDVYKQYEHFVYFITKIPKRIKIIICGGNHDALRISEPQPILEKNYVGSLYEKENISFVTNPSLVNIQSSKDFSGFDVLIYHGYSFPYFADLVDSIRMEGGQKRADLIMKFLLQRRHLAPTHTSNLYIPDANQDPLLIDKVPDFFITGHIHRVNSINYRNITGLNCGCWVSQSEEQKKRGLVPDPSKIFLVNLQTREVKIRDFSKNE